VPSLISSTRILEPLFRWEIAALRRGGAIDSFASHHVSWTGNIKDNPRQERFDIRSLSRSGFDVKKLSIAGKAYHVGLPSDTLVESGAACQILRMLHDQFTGHLRACPFRLRSGRAWRAFTVLLDCYTSWAGAFISIMRASIHSWWD
jgi:hypothetical protein